MATLSIRGHILETRSEVGCRWQLQGLDLGVSCFSPENGLWTEGPVPSHGPKGSSGLAGVPE